MLTKAWAVDTGAMRITRILCAAAAIGLSSGCTVSHYVDGSTKEVSTAQYRKPAQPRPVQLVFVFQKLGVASEPETLHWKAQVADQVKAAGLFSEVSDVPVTSGAVLDVTLNHVSLTDNVFSKGFVSGLALGLHGNSASDGYICTVRYQRDNAATPVVKLARHAIYATVNASDAPLNAVKAENVDAAVSTMTRQILSNALGDLSNDPDFK